MPWSPYIKCLTFLIEEALKIYWLLFYREFLHALWFGLPAYIEVEVMRVKALKWLNYKKQRLKKNVRNNKCPQLAQRWSEPLSMRLPYAQVIRKGLTGVLLKQTFGQCILLKKLIPSCLLKNWGILIKIMRFFWRFTWQNVKYNFRGPFKGKISVNGN